MRPEARRCFGFNGGADEMPGNMSKEDAPSRSASLTFTIDSILNLKQRDGEDLDASKGQSGWKRDFQARRDEAWDVRRRHCSGPDETGNWEFHKKYR